MIPSNFAQQLAVGANQHFKHPATSILTQNSLDRTSIVYAQEQVPISGVVVSQLPTIVSPSVIAHPRVGQQKVVSVVGPLVQSQVRPVSDVRSSNGGNIIQNGSEAPRKSMIEQLKKSNVQVTKKESSSFDLQKEELREQIKRLHGLLKKNQSQCESARRQLNHRNQIISEFERKISYGEQHQSKFNVQIKTIQQQNLKLKSIIERMNIDRDNLISSHEKYMKSDEAVRTEIFGQVQKLQKVIQQKSKQLQESKQRELLTSKQFQAFRSQVGNQLNEGERNTVHLMEKLKVALQGKQVQIQSLNQAIHQLNTNLSNSNNIRSQQLYKIKSLESQVLRLESQNSSLKNFQSHHQDVTFQLGDVNNLKNHIAGLQKQLSVYKQRDTVTTSIGDRSITEKDVQISKLKSALQSAQSSNVTLQYLSKQISNYKIIIQDLETYKQNGYKKDIEITRLHQTIVGKQKQLVQLQNQKEILKGKLLAMEGQSSLIQQSLKERIRQEEEKSIGLRRKIQIIETQKLGIAQLSSTHHDIDIGELTKALNNSRNEFFNLRRSSEQKIFELETVKANLETQIFSITQVIEQKESQKLYFEKQYKTLYSQYSDFKKSTPGFEPFNQEIRQLKEELLHSRQQYGKLETEFKKILNGGDKRIHGQESIRNKGTVDMHKKHKQQHYRQTQSMTGLRQENQHLKQLLEDARMKLEQYSGDLQECQQRMISFQGRMQNLLSGGNQRPPNYHESVNQQKQMMNQVVYELQSKLKLFKKQNDQLKKKIKESKSENRRNRQSKQKLKNVEKKKINQQVREEQQERVHERITDQRLDELQTVVQSQSQEINKLTIENQNLVEELTSVNEINNQNQITIKEYMTNITQYEKAMVQYEARIKQYQNYMLKIKHKYKEEAHTRLPEPEIERPTNVAMQNVEERLQFFRTKNLQSEERIKHLLSINNQLKVQLQQASSLMGGQNLHTQKIQLLQDNISYLQKKLLKSTEENLELRARMENVDNNPNLSSILELKIRQLMEQNSELKIQINQASNQIVSLKQGFGGQVSNHSDILKLEHLQRKFSDLNQVIDNLQAEKRYLHNQNQELKSSIGRENISGENVLLEQIANLHQQIYQLKVANRQLEIQTKQMVGNAGVSIDTYSNLMIEVDKIIQLTDAFHAAFSSIIDDVAKMGSQSLKESIDGMVSEVVDALQGISRIKNSLGGLRQQSETATVIHEINQII